MSTRFLLRRANAPLTSDRTSLSLSPVAGERDTFLHTIRPEDSRVRRSEDPVPTLTGIVSCALRKAPLVRRLAAHIIDGLIPLPFLVPLLPCWALVVATYALFADALPGGMSLGKRLMGLRVVTIVPNPGRSCSLARSVLRNLNTVVVRVCYASILLTPLGMALSIIEALCAVLRPDGRRLGDLIAGTQVIATETFLEERL